MFFDISENEYEKKWQWNRIKNISYRYQKIKQIKNLENMKIK